MRKKITNTSKANLTISGKTLKLPTERRKGEFKFGDKVCVKELYTWKNGIFVSKTSRNLQNFADILFMDEINKITKTMPVHMASLRKGWKT